MSAEDALSQVVIVVDTVNTGVLRTSLERTQLDSFLRRNGGKLPYPVSIRFFGEKGVVPIGPASRDGNALAELLKSEDASFKPVRRAAGFYGEVEVMQMSLAGLGALATEEEHQPGHKLVIWLSQGWSLLVNHDAWTTDKESVGFFQTIVAMSSVLRRARITLDSVYPMEVPGAESLRPFRYQDYVKGVRNPKRAMPGNLALPTLAEQSGGEALVDSNEPLADTLEHAIARAGADYFMAFKPAAAKQADEYHGLTVTVNRPGVVVKAREGYYNQP
jgi:VWFA-related protein